MASPGRPDSRVVRAIAGALSAVLHGAVLAIVLLSGTAHDGVYESDTPLTRLALLRADDADRAPGLTLPPIETGDFAPAVERPHLAEVASDPEFAPLPAPAMQSVASLVPIAESAPAATDAAPPVPQDQEQALFEQLARLAEQYADTERAHVEWEQDGRRYRAALRMERARDGMSPDRVIAQVSAAAHGKELMAQVTLRRLPFSQFAHMVDRWDPLVQFHDDEIAGRVHSNTPFNLLYDSRTAPRFLGKVTTAARTFRTYANGRRRDAEIFQGGIQTRAGRIEWPQRLEPLAWAPLANGARVHELEQDTRIVFLGDDGYRLHAVDSPTAPQLLARADGPVYLVGAPTVTLYVVAGTVLVYSPHRIVIEGSLTYARDARQMPDAPDYLGLVCDKNIEIAPPRVTGPGDLAIHGALFAGRRFVITHIDHRRMGTLRIFGSLTAGSVSASEPRYATRLEYDPRFEERRPPGFPSTNRFEVETWDGRWIETERSASETL
jgi:hypothetical protein